MTVIRPIIDKMIPSLQVNGYDAHRHGTPGEWAFVGLLTAMFAVASIALSRDPERAKTPCYSAAVTASAGDFAGSAPTVPAVGIK